MWRDACNAENTHEEPFGFAAESKAHQVSDNFPGEIETAPQLDVKTAITEDASVLGQRVVLKFDQEVADLTAGCGIAVEDVLLHFRRDFEFAGHAHPMVAKGSACSAFPFGRGGGRRCRGAVRSGTVEIREEFAERNVGGFGATAGLEFPAQILRQIAARDADDRQQNSVVTNNFKQQFPALLEGEQIHAVFGNGDLAFGPDG